MAPQDLKPADRRLKRHSSKTIGQLAASIREFKFVNPIICDRHSTIVAGHGRWEAAKLLGLETVPTVCVDHLSPEQIRAYRITDNKLAELSGWDRNALSLELQELDALELDFDLEITGFSSLEIEELKLDLDDAADDEEHPEVLPDKRAISRPGDLWLLGEHRLHCADALQSPSMVA